MKILTASQMREVDEQTTERFGIPSMILMENAGIGVVQAIEKHFGDLHHRPIAILCGKGNNGGDGFVVARQLILRGLKPEVFLFADSTELKEDALINFEILQKSGHSIISLYGCPEEALGSLFLRLQQHLVIDALLGTGTRLPVEGFYAIVLKYLRTVPHLVSIDVPSGLECESLLFSQRELLAPIAELTVTFTAPKPAHIFSPAAECSRKWQVVPIGSPEMLIEDPKFFLNYFTSQEAQSALKPFRRPPASHKGTYGHLLAIGGSLGKTGAASLMAQSALLSGAGLVTLATASPCLPIVASQHLEIMTEPLEATETGAISHRAFEYGRMEAVLRGKDMVALGPGLGTHRETVQFIFELLDTTSLPIVLDADGINAFHGRLERLQGKDRLLVLTPHPGEFARLMGVSTASVLENRIDLVRQFALERQLHLVLKGHRTIYATPSGQLYVNSTGNPGMATGGSGDVLTGLLAGLALQALCRQIPLEPTLALAVYLHGLAGDLAGQVRGEASLIASDLMAYLPGAFLQTLGSDSARQA
jgi:hydroxyethylthiazole kinase-like uncharacterized protein yjeF